MRFFEAPPEEIYIDGIAYHIDTDFRVWIEFQNLITQNISDEEKTANLIFFIQKMGLPFSENTLSAIIEFFKGGEPDKPKTENKNPAYDFESDGSLIFSAFLTQYKFDLTDVKMHWWKFKSLFSGLNDEHMISKVMWARTTDKSKLSKEMKEYADKINEAYPIKGRAKMTVEERNKQWMDYVKRRFEEAEKSRVSILRDAE